MTDHSHHPHPADPEIGLESDEGLLKRFSQTRDQLIREELVLRFSGLAETFARRYSDRGERIEDLIQVAQLGLLKAIDGFDDQRGTSFRAYAEPTILGELRRYFRDKRWAMRVPRDLKEALPRIRTAVDDLSTELGREPRPAEVADRASMEEAEVLEALQASDASRPSSLDAPVVVGSDDDAAPMAERIGDVDGNYEQTEWGVMLEERLDELSERDREVLYLRYARDLTQREIGERVGVSQMQVSRILRDVLDKLRDSG